MTDKKPHWGEAELENALAHGNTDRETAARKVLAAAGVERAATKRKTAAADDEQARSEPPQKRQTPVRHKAD